MAQEESHSIVVCTKENGAFSTLWGRKCWVADSILSLVESHVETLCQKYADLPEQPFNEIRQYCEELRVKNGLRREVGQIE